MRLFSILAGSALLFSCGSPNSNQDTAQTDTLASLHADTIHHARNSLDWFGNYKGELPTGLVLDVTINSDNTFAVRSTNQATNEVVEDTGSIEWASDNNYFNLKGDRVDYHFKIEENRLVYIEDLHHIPTDTTTLESYVLEKQEQYPTY